MEVMKIDIEYTSASTAENHVESQKEKERAPPVETNKDTKGIPITFSDFIFLNVFNEIVSERK